MLLRVKKRENGDSSHYRFEFVIKRKDQSDERWRDLAENFGRLQAVAKLITSKGESSSPRSGGSFNDSEAMFGTDFSDADDAKLLRVEFPQELQTLDAKFEFKDLPLP